MSNDISFNDLKNAFLSLSEVIAKSPIDLGDLLIDYTDDLDALYERNFQCFKDAKDLLNKAKANDDKVATQAALVYIRVYAMGLSSFFETFKDDADSFLKESIWPDIPEDYQVPEHYNFQHK